MRKQSNNPKDRVFNAIAKIQKGNHRSIFDEVNLIEELLEGNERLFKMLPFKTRDELESFFQFHYLIELVKAINLFFDHPNCQNMGHYQYINKLMGKLTMESVGSLFFDKDRFESLAKKIQAKVAALSKYMQIESSPNPTIPYDLFLQIMSKNELTLDDLQITQDEFDTTLKDAFRPFIKKLTEEAKKIPVEQQQDIIADINSCYKAAGSTVKVTKILPDKASTTPSTGSKEPKDEVAQAPPVETSNQVEIPEIDDLENFEVESEIILELVSLNNPDDEELIKDRIYAIIRSMNKNNIKESREEIKHLESKLSYGIKLLGINLEDMAHIINRLDDPEVCFFKDRAFPNKNS